MDTYICNFATKVHKIIKTTATSPQKNHHPLPKIVHHPLPKKFYWPIGPKKHNPAKTQIPEAKLTIIVKAP